MQIMSNGSPDPRVTAAAIRAAAREMADASWRLDQAISAAHKSANGYRAVTGGHCNVQPPAAIRDAELAALDLLAKHNWRIAA